MNNLFIDTWGWLTLRDKREKYHRAVSDYFDQIYENDTNLYTSDYVLDETYTLFFKRLPFSFASDSMRLMNQMIANQTLWIVQITPERFTKTQELRLKLQDKPNISFTDLSSMVVMKELGLQYILTADSHFTHVGMDFIIVPATH